MVCVGAIGISFQFTPLREGRQSWLNTQQRRLNFNSRPSARGDSGAGANPGAEAISIHAPPRGATKPKRGIRWQTMNFNSRTSARGDLEVQCMRMRYLISIHAPPRGATDTARGWEKKRLKFQFTPLREGRPVGGFLLRFRCDFNSRPSARGDQLQPVQGEGWHISIHAPPRGATRKLQTNLDRIKFQFTPLREGRPSSHKIAVVSSPFQFTPLREGRRQIVSDQNTHLLLFQFTPLREGRPCTAISLDLVNPISIHAPPRRATRDALRRPCALHLPFQFTPLREGRHTARGWEKKRWKFQFTPLREGRHIRVTRSSRSVLFQFTPLREGRLQVAETRAKVRQFQFTPLREGRRASPAGR